MGRDPFKFRLTTTVERFGQPPETTELFLIGASGVASHLGVSIATVNNYNRFGQLDKLVPEQRVLDIVITHKLERVIGNADGDIYG